MKENHCDKNKELLKVNGLRTHFFTDAGEIKAVNGVSFSVRNGETLGIVGESGCGKSVTVRSIMRLVKTPPAKIMGGEILFENHDLLKISEKEMQDIRGKRISMIFQEPMTALNPVFTVGYQIAEVILRHNKKLSRAQANEQALEMLRMVEIPDPERRIHNYPHQFSGGMRQRVVIAIALACSPKLLIADEPTTALDVTIQAQILDLMRKLKEEQGTSILMITHDLGIVAEMCDRVAVMYGGEIVEQGNVKEIYKSPLHPYTRGLLRSLPRIDQETERLYTIEGAVPNPKDLPKGCKFSTRCAQCAEKCKESPPEYKEMTSGHFVACHLANEVS
ncbi:MAG: ABC transporter ATP-binding protein [Puniceicoccales bacterium]|jgi:oligopeptide/dipeptide ABC transporter ATP-binding protein|nr:ABC transporter ATP-binding protein [Puniceicoccales bacterium]